MNIYSSNTTNFERNGYGFLNDCISATVTESLNGDYYLNLEYPLNASMSEYLVEDNVIKCNVGNNNYQLFRIKRVVKDFTTLSIYAIHISYDLLDNLLLDVYPKDLTCTNYGQWLFDNTNFENNFTFYSDITTSASGRYVRKNPIEAIMGSDDNSMLNLFGGEIERDNFTFKLLSHRGNDNHVKLLFGKNITSIKITTDITSLYTRIIPVGYDGLLLPEKYVDSPIIGNYPTPKITKVEFSDIKYDETGETENAYTNIEDAYQALRDGVNALYNAGTDKPAITIKINWVELSKTEQYKNQYSALERVRLGDTITAEILGLDYSTEVTKTTYNVLTDNIDSFEIGTITKSIANTLNNQTKAIEAVNPSSILDDAKTNASNQIANAMGGYVYKTNEELYIMDTDDITTAQKVWRWNLNGLGYSSTGVNGTYSTAITQDGQIVADFITTGKLNTSVIQGYDTLEIKVNDASTNASTALSTANTANTTANTANTNATTAQTAAATAQSTADDASSVASNAQSLANTANTTANNVRTDLDNLDYVDSGTFENYQTTVSTTYAQKSDGFEFNFDKIVTQINSQVSSGISENNAELHKYIRFVDGVIYLGASDSEVQAVLTNTGLYFVPKGTTSDFEENAIAFFSNGKMTINDATVFTSMKISNFAFKPRTNGNLSFGKVGD